MKLGKSSSIAGFSVCSTMALVLVMLVGIACTKQNATYKEQVKTALEQADLKDVSVSEDTANRTITLTGTLHSEESKEKADEIARANAGKEVVANEISVEPIGNESAARGVESNQDDAIEKNYKAALLSKGLDKQHIHYDAKNGVLILKGSVKNTKEREQAEELAQNTPNVRQVLNQISVQR
jgi:osmotically-inducible protein OsmY